MLLSDRMKQYEQAEAGRYLLPLVPVMARMDGKTFHNFTKDFNRPFDVDFHQAMIKTTQFLLEKTGAIL